MPKMKTQSRAKKTFKVTGSGKIKRQQAGMRHLMRKKTKSTKTRLGHATLVHEADHARMERMLLA
jgi:large subunit ribosomal protein L35